MKQSDENFCEKIETIAKQVSVRSTDTGILKKISDEVDSKTKTARGVYDGLIKGGEPRDPFMDKVKLEIQICENIASNIVKDKERLLAKHK